jgi:trehalose/maltose hydrolase-like predicted phosphorylase
VVAAYSLTYATDMGKLLGVPTPANWTAIAEKIKIPFDEKRQIHLEYDGYTNEEIKQADVVLLGYPLMYPMSDQIRYNDLEFYR